ncbi:MAG: helix-turn-helix domain-containing protein [Terrimicrobiaceae bacterium]|nr:helix-turn-helix domain-containing protein [Terrimicrobiaceae bacterium]
MRAGKEVPALPVSTVWGDEFRKDAAYFCRRPRGSGDWLIILTMGGAGLIRAAGAHREVLPGDILLYEPGAAQDYRTAPRAGRWHLLWVHFAPRTSWRPWLDWDAVGPGTRCQRLTGEALPHAAEALRRVRRNCGRSGLWHEELAFVALKEAILWVNQSRESPPTLDPRIEKALGLLRDEYRRPFDLPALCAQCGLSVSRFSHLFRRQTGLSAGEFLELKRLTHAGHLLRLTTMPVKQIAAECGYDDALHFSKRFRRHHGASPRDWRQRHVAA